MKDRKRSVEEYTKLIEQNQFDSIQYYVMTGPRSPKYGWVPFASQFHQSTRDVVALLSQSRSEHERSEKKFREVEKRHEQNKEVISDHIRNAHDKELKDYLIQIKNIAKPAAAELVLQDQDSLKKVEDLLKEKADSKIALTTQRKDYLRALAKLTDNTETTKIQHELDILCDQKALLSRVLLRLELEAQGITITPEDLPVKKEK